MDDEDWFERAVEGEETDSTDGESATEAEGEAAESPPAGDGDPFDSDAEPLDVDLEDGESFGFESDEDQSFEEEPYQADLPRIDLGIDGLDAMIQEGVPERSTMAVVGGAGTGKTTFALQFVQRAIEQDGQAVYITLEETRDGILDSARQKGWDFASAVEAGNVAVLDMDPTEMANSLTSIRSELPHLVAEFGADRLVLDSVSLLEMMYDEQATRRTEIYNFTRSLEEAGVTTLVTSEASQDTPYASRFGIIEYLTDAVFVLRYVRPDQFQETRLAVEIQKIRDANHSRETKPYEITSGGLSVYRDASIF